jgi:hypothetical protein
VRLTDDAIAYAPDVAVYLVNDLSTRGRKQLVARGIKSEPYQPRWLARRSMLWLKLEKNAVSTRLERVAARKDIANRLDLDAIGRDLRRDLDQLVVATEAVHVLPVLVGLAPRIRREQPVATQAANAMSRVLYMPNVYIGDMTESFYRNNDELRAVAAARRAPYIETIDKMPARAEYYVDSSHTTRQGSRALGAIVGEEMARDPAVRARLNAHGRGCADAG